MKDKPENRIKKGKKQAEKKISSGHPAQKVKKEERLSSPVKSLSEEVAWEKQRVKKVQGFNFGRIFLGLFIIFVGLVLLGKTTGFYHLEVDLLSLWPVLLIAFGLSLLSRQGWLSFFIAAIVTLLVILLVGFAFYLDFVSSKGRFISQVESELISIPYERGAREAAIKVRTGGGRLSVESGQAGLVTGRFNSSFLKLVTSSKVRDGVQEVSIETRGSLRFFARRPQNELNLSVSSLIPVDLYLETGAMKMEMDLTEIKARTVEIKSGASSLRLALGDRLKNSKVKINSGASSIDISLPSSVGVRLKIKGGLVSKSLPGFKEVREGVYLSENYNQAAKKIRVFLDIGVSDLKVSRY